MSSTKCATNFENGGKRLRKDLDFPLDMTWGWDIPLPTKFKSSKYPKSGGNTCNKNRHKVQLKRRQCARDRKHSVKCNVVTFGPVNGKIVGIIPESHYYQRDLDDRDEDVYEVGAHYSRGEM